MDPKVRKGLDDLLGFVAQEIERDDLEKEEVDGAQVVELAAQLRHEDEMEALMAGEPQPTAPFEDYLREAQRRLEASE
jgi:hypothetical protein